MAKYPLASKVSLVTGAARRIGAEIARTLHNAGSNVVIHYHHSRNEALHLCQALNDKRPHSAIALPADLKQPASVKTLVQQAQEYWQRLDILVNNASRFYRTTIGTVTEDAWEDLVDSNLKAPFFLAQAASTMLAESQGCIVNITDIHGEKPLRDYSVYCISKSGLIMLTKVLAKELGPKIRVNGVSPGAILWPEGENSLTEEEKHKIIEQTALHYVGEPQYIAQAVLFFVADAPYVTGQILAVDGGRLL